MHKKSIKKRILLMAICFSMIAYIFHTVVYAQNQKHIRVGQAQCFFKDYGCEPELTPDNFLSWPAQYGDNQHTTRQKGLWIGCTDFNDPVEGAIKSVKVIGIGPRLPVNQFTMVFPKSIRKIQMIGKYPHPDVYVDGVSGTSNTLYDSLDVFDADLFCDRMVVMKFHTSMGVTITRKIMAFTQQNHDDYFIQEYIFTNTGIYNEAGDTQEPVQTLDNFWVYFTYRYAFAGVTSAAHGSTWGSFGSQWGTSTLVCNFVPGTAIEHPLYPDMRWFYAWYGPTNSWSHALNSEQDWGCPDHEETGVLGAAKYTGVVTLFASQGPGGLFGTDDPDQPATTAYTGSDGDLLELSVSQYNENYMQRRYDIMTEGHLNHTMWDEARGTVDPGGFVDEWTGTAPYRNTGTTGSVSQGQGFGPYTLGPDDSIRIVFAEGVNGLRWEKCREIGANWYAYYMGTSQPELILPDGSPATSQNEYNYAAHNWYKRAWCETGEDSILKVLQNAQTNFNSGYNIPQPPPAPQEFNVQSGSDRIRLTWADNASTIEHFDGYVIYRARGGVKDYQTVYEKIFECNAANVVHQFDDVTATRGFDYYYYIQSKDDGSQNDVELGTPLYSSLFLTLTTEPAQLQRPTGETLSEVCVVPNPYDIRSRMWQFGDRRGGVDPLDRIAFYGLPPICNIKIFTERGDLIWGKYHDNYTGDELWDSKTSSGQIVVSGIYILVVQLTQTIKYEEDVYDTAGEILHERGDVMFRKGETVYRKFVIIR